ncbi:hypothetical protein GCM10029963_52030 [Micromonospora andamanensis]
MHDVRATVDALAVWQATGRPRLVVPPAEAVAFTDTGPGVQAAVPPGGVGETAVEGRARR